MDDASGIVGRRSARARRRDEMRRRLLEVVQQLLDEGESFTETYDDVRAPLETVVMTYRPHTPLMAAAFDAAAYDASLRHLVTGLMDTNAAGLRKHIREGQAHGFVDARLHPAETAEWLTGMAERGLHRAVRTASPDQLFRLVDGLADIVWNTLYAPARRPHSDSLAA